MIKENKCAVCRYCTFEQDTKCFVCHNEQSRNYGKWLKEKELNCDDFSNHTYSDMRLKDALEIITLGTQGMFPHYRLPNKVTHAHAFVAVDFKDNESMAQWYDALARLFDEYMKRAKADGDFVTEDDIKIGVIQRNRK